SPYATLFRSPPRHLAHARAPARATLAPRQLLGAATRHPGPLLPRVARVRSDDAPPVRQVDGPLRLRSPSGQTRAGRPPCPLLEADAGLPGAALVARPRPGDERGRALAPAAPDREPQLPPATDRRAPRDDAPRRGRPVPRLGGAAGGPRDRRRRGDDARDPAHRGRDPVQRRSE